MHARKHTHTIHTHTVRPAGVCVTGFYKIKAKYFYNFHKVLV